MKCSRYGSACSSVASASSSLEVAQEAQDQAGADAQLGLRALAGTVQAADHRADVDAARGVGLRVEEDLGMHDVVGRGARSK